MTPLETWIPDRFLHFGSPPLAMQVKTMTPRGAMRRTGGARSSSCGDPGGGNRVSSRERVVSAFAITLLLGLVALVAVPTARAASPPTRPQALQSSAGDTAVTLSWLAPSSDGGSPITAYKVYRGGVSGGGTLLVTVGDVRTYFDSGLVHGQTYYYQVSGVNAIGEGIRSNEVSATPPQVVGIPWVRQFGSVSSSRDYATTVAIDA